MPDTVNVRHWKWDYAITIFGMHVLALLAFAPGLFSWSGVGLAVAGLYVFGTLGINLGYHRLLTHRGFECSLFLEHCLALIGVCCMQDSPAHWVAVHRLHHQHSDERPDPHSPLVTFLWSHIGWLLVENHKLDRLSMVERYAKDLLRDRFYLRLENRPRLTAIIFTQWAAFFAAGYVVGAFRTGRWRDGMALGLSWLVWGVFVRTVAVWHITWSVNSISHLWGYQTYATHDGSRNNIFVGLLSNGEGWHNNHHAEPRAAAHGHAWWEIDVTYWSLCILARLGLARNIIRPTCQPICQPTCAPPHADQVMRNGSQDARSAARSRRSRRCLPQR